LPFAGTPIKDINKKEKRKGTFNLRADIKVSGLTGEFGGGGAIGGELPIETIGKLWHKRKERTPIARLRERGTSAKNSRAGEEKHRRAVPTGPA